MFAGKGMASHCELFYYYYATMKFALLLALALFITPFSFAQTIPSTGDLGAFSVGFQDLNFSDSNLANPNVDVKVYYPGASGGPNAPVSTGTFPVLAFGHGFNLNYLDYELICNHLASWGYIVISPDVQNGFSVDHLEFARELAACIQWLQAEGQNSGSDFFGSVDSVSGVLGHSMGGGASALVPSVFPGINAVSGLAAAETNPSAIAALGNYNGPYQVISGESDNTAPENTNQVPMYNATTGDKQWVSITGGAHCKFTDNPTICDLVSSAGSISRDDQIYLARKYTTAFFNYYLKQDNQALPFLCGDSVMTDQANTVISYSTNINCTTVGISDPIAQFEIFPNPAQDHIRIQGSREINVYAVDGRFMGTFSEPGNEEIVIDLASWPAGIYFLVGEKGRATFLHR